MKPQDYLRVTELFRAACDLEGADRAAFLQEACGDDDVLRAEVEALLAHDHGGDDAFAEARLGLARELTAETSETAPVPDRAGLAQPGSRIGPYKLLSVLGEGGFGVVYLAEQREPIHRQVALKVIKAGMDTKRVLARFEAERQALAMMDHPNIARVLSAGATETGRPYFVMELVRGEPVTEYCDRHKLGIDERLELFIQVCHAVQHAHQKGVIHRDLKPSNVLVAVHDDRPVPKVIDFGVAKATAHRLTERTLFTERGQLIGTPEYMSPEQAEMSALDVDTRSDVYSLGVLLYELLTGMLPFDRKELRSAGLGDVQRIIRQVEPPKPSTRLSALVHERCTELAESRRTDARSLRRVVRGDLDWITLEAMEKDRTRRYDTASALAGDIRRHLDHEPIVARPPSTWYQLGKFARRNRALVGGAAAVFLVLTCGVVGTTLGLLHARRAQRESDAARRAEEIARHEETTQRKRALRQEKVAKQRHREARQSLYCTHMVIARRDWEDGLLSRFRQLLDAHRPGPGEPDLRRWEWFYLQGLFHRDLCTLRGHAGPVHCVAWSPDGRWLASAGDDCAVRIWDLAEERPTSVLKGHTASVGFIAWGGDSRRLASASDDGTVKLWDTAKGVMISSASGHRGPVSAVGWDPNGQQLASGGQDGTVRILQAAREGESFALGSVGAAVWSLAWSPDGRRLVASHGHGLMRVWDMVTRRRERDVRDDLGHGRAISLAWHPNGSILATGTEHSVQLRDAATGERIRLLRDHKGKVRSVAWSPDGTRLASASEDETAKIWDPNTGEVVAMFCGHVGPVRSVTWSPDGRRLATGGQDGTIKLWDALRTEEAARRRVHENWISCIDWSPDGRWIASSYFRRTVEVWDPVSGDRVLALRGHRGRVWHVAWSPDGRRLATGGDDNVAIVWDAKDGTQLATLRVHKRKVAFVDWSPSGGKLALASYDSTVSIWSATTWKLLHRLPGHQRTVDAAVWSPDGRYLVTGTSDQFIRIFDANTGERLGALATGAPRLVSLAWSPDGSQLASGSEDGTVAVWSFRSRRKLFSIPAHASAARGVTWSPDGCRIASGGTEGDVKIRDAITGEEVLTIAGHGAEVFTVAWSPDGRRLASGSFDKTVKIWDAAVGYDLEARRPVRLDASLATRAPGATQPQQTGGAILKRPADPGYTPKGKLKCIDLKPKANGKLTPHRSAWQ